MKLTLTEITIIKNALVRAQLFEMAAKFRDIEKEHTAPVDPVLTKHAEHNNAEFDKMNNELDKIKWRKQGNQMVGNIVLKLKLTKPVPAKQKKSK